MGNRKAREYQLKQEQEADRQRINNEPRLAVSRVSAYGAGPLRMQLIVRPSFEEAKVWEVCADLKEWSLYRSRVVQTAPAVMLLGYERLPFESARLSSYFERVIALSLPLGLHLNGLGGLDGTNFQFAIFGDLSSSWRFEWWSDSPAQWKPLIDIFDEMITAFSSIGE
jgi:hypothetical protein